MATCCSKCKKIDGANKRMEAYVKQLFYQGIINMYSLCSVSGIIDITDFFFPSRNQMKINNYHVGATLASKSVRGWLNHDSALWGCNLFVAFDLQKMVDEMKLAARPHVYFTTSLTVAPFKNKVVCLILHRRLISNLFCQDCFLHSDDMSTSLRSLPNIQ